MKISRESTSDLILIARRASRSRPIAVVLFLLLAALVSASAARAEEAPAPSPDQAGTDEIRAVPVSNNFNYQPYCGIQSLYSALHILGRQEVSFSQLIRPRYLDSWKGSSLAALMRSASDFGLKVQPLRAMTSVMLRMIETPVILHVRADLDVREYEHWILFAGVQDGKARIIDGAKPVELMGFDELAARWDGVGLIVSRGPIPLVPLRLYSAIPLILGGLLAVLAVLALRSLQRTRDGQPTGAQLAGRYAVQAMGILPLTALIVLLAAWLSPESGMFNRSAIAAVQKREVGAIFPKITAAQARRIKDRHQAIFIDARFRNDFDHGHISGALSLPPDTPDAACEGVLANIPKNKDLVIYCQSSGCPYSEKVAGKLFASGYRSLTIFEDGWQGWESAYPNGTASR